MENSALPIVIVGGGHAGVALCSELASAGLGAQVHLVCAEARLPYQRPPLSKTYLKSTQESIQSHRGAAWFADAGITLHLGDPATAIDRARKKLTLASGLGLPYRWLVLATGTSARKLPSIPHSMRNVALLRSADDAERLRDMLPTVHRVTVIGGGFIGLEIAATARSLGKEVVVLETASRLLARSASAELAEHVLLTHRASGIDLRLGTTIGDIEHDGTCVTALTVDGRKEAVELLVVGIGATPSTSLAEAAGLACDNGILVDAFLHTSDPSILAIGDVANFPLFGAEKFVRLESVQNASDQARTAVSSILGQPTSYRSLPWFWSDQGAIRLQMAGLVPTTADSYRRTGTQPNSFSILHYVQNRLVCVESVNAPADHLAARRLLEAGISPDPMEARDPKTPLKQFLSNA